MRTTKTSLREEVARLQRNGFNIAINWACGQPRCTDLDGSRDISPRLTMGEMKIWLHGYEAGTKAKHTHISETELTEEKRRYEREIQKIRTQLTLAHNSLRFVKDVIDDQAARFHQNCRCQLCEAAPQVIDAAMRGAIRD